MSETISQRAADIERILETHYWPRYHELQDRILRLEQELAGTQQRRAHVLAAFETEERLRQEDLAAKKAALEAEVRELESKRELEEAELAGLHAYLNQGKAGES